METRIYTVRENGVAIALVEAQSQAQAIRITVGERFTAEVPTTKQYAALVSQGVKQLPEAQGMPTQPNRETNATIQ